MIGAPGRRDTQDRSARLSRRFRRAPWARSWWRSTGPGSRISPWERGSSVGGASALTAAELRLLPLLTTHLSFPEIAAEMFPSRCTIKTRAMSIYRKLAASSRSQAVARSRELEDPVRAACEALGLRYGVYAGATPQHERARMRDNPPDILLTNYSMLEFILTRREDRKLFGAGVLRHLVLDEIHTYQGALGSEIACLVRRLRGHVDTAGLVCVGLSATVSAGETTTPTWNAPPRSPRTCSPPHSARTRS